MNLIQPFNYNMYNYDMKFPCIGLEDFKTIIGLAKSTKQTGFILNENKLIGSDSECNVLYEVTLDQYYPFIYFSKDDMMNAINTGMFENYTNFVLKDNICIIPADLMHAVTDLKFYTDIERSDIINITSESIFIDDNFPIMKVNLTCTRDKDFKTSLTASYNNFMTYCYVASAPTHVFYNMEENEDMQSVFNGKTDDGVSIIRLNAPEKVFMMSLFKGFFPMNKGDKINVYIYDGLYRGYIQPGIFTARFEIIKKKKVVINVYACFINLS